MLCFQATAVSLILLELYFFFFFNDHSSHFHINWLEIISNNKLVSVAICILGSQSNIYIILVAA